MYYYLLTRFLVKPQAPRDSCASCRKYESMSNCLTHAAVTPDKISLVNLMTTFADILTCAIFCISWGATTASAAQQAFPHKALQSSRSDWTTGEPIGSRAAGYLNSPQSAQLNQTTSSDFSNIILSYVTARLSSSVCSATPAARLGRPRKTFSHLFHYFYIKCHQDGNLLHPFTFGSLLMHLLIVENLRV